MSQLVPVPERNIRRPGAVSAAKVAVDREKARAKTAQATAAAEKARAEAEAIRARAAAAKARADREAETERSREKERAFKRQQKAKNEQEARERRKRDEQLRNAALQIGVATGGLAAGSIGGSLIGKKIASGSETFQKNRVASIAAAADEARKEQKALNKSMASRARVKVRAIQAQDRLKELGKTPTSLTARPTLAGVAGGAVFLAGGAVTISSALQKEAGSGAQLLGLGAGVAETALGVKIAASTAQAVLTSPVKEAAKDVAELRAAKATASRNLAGNTVGKASRAATSKGGLSLLRIVGKGVGAVAQRTVLPLTVTAAGVAAFSSSAQAGDTLAESTGKAAVAATDAVTMGAFSLLTSPSAGRGTLRGNRKPGAGNAALDEQRRLFIARQQLAKRRPSAVPTVKATRDADSAIDARLAARAQRDRLKSPDNKQDRQNYTRLDGEVVQLTSRQARAARRRRARS